MAHALLSLYLATQMLLRWTAVILLKAYGNKPCPGTSEQCGDVSCIYTETGGLCAEWEVSSEGMFPMQPAKPLLGMSPYTGAQEMLLPGA